MAEPARHGGRFEQVAGVVQRAFDAAIVFMQQQGQIELCAVPGDLLFGQAQAG